MKRGSNQESERYLNEKASPFHASFHFSVYSLFHVVWDDILGRYFGMKIFSFSTEKNLLSTNKFSSQNIVISSQNNVQKYHLRRHEKRLTIKFFTKHTTQYLISISVNIDPNDDCIDLAVFIGGESGSVFSIPNGDSRNGQWSIKISQFNCGFNNLPPQGCTQWYFGQLSGIVRYLVLSSLVDYLT